MLLQLALEQHNQWYKPKARSEEVLLGDAVFKDYNLQFKDFSTTFKDLICFQLVSRDLNFKTEHKLKITG